MRTPSTSFIVIVATRLLLFGLAAGALAFGYFVIGAPGDRSADGGVSYTCPMHPEVVTKVPGDCPICHMALEPKKERHAQDDELVTTLPPGAELRRYDARSRAKIFESSLEMRGPGWAEDRAFGVVLLHLDEVGLLSPDEPAIFSPSTPKTNGAPDGIPVRYTGEPATRWDNRTSVVRFRVEPGAALEPGRTGDVKFGTRLRRDLVVKSSAVLREPEGTYVLVVADDLRTLTKRRVEVGSMLYGYASVVSGLRENEYVAATQAFFLDTERRLHGRAAQ